MTTDPDPIALRRNHWFVGIVAIVTIGLASAWSVIARRELRASVAPGIVAELDHDRAVFELTRERQRDGLRAQCRLLVEDPRVKSTLATEGMDEGTVTDILRDLRRLRGRGFLLVLSANGHVFAQAGADELHGLDLSASNVVKNARTSSEAVVGSWVIGNRLIDLGIMTVRFDTTILAYLVVGEAIDRPFVQAFADAAGVTAAILFGDDGSITSSDDAKLVAAIGMFVRGAPGVQPRIVELAGTTYGASVADLAQSGPSQARLALLRAIEPTRAYVLLGWLLFVPPVLVVAAVFLASSRASYRVS